MSAAETKKSIFEAETCTRCGGSGKHSYCASYGDRCFKCVGKGLTLSKRGAAAQAFFTALCTTRADGLHVGDHIWTHGGPLHAAGWCLILSAAYTDPAAGGASYTEDGETSPYFEIITDVIDLCTFPGVEYRVRQSREARAAKVAEALAYQATLTKAGHVSKASRKAA